MRQGDGSDLLGQNDPRNADIGILYVGPEDSRQEILTAINTQELQGRKQIAIVLPEQGKAFRQPVEFDGLKNMRRGLKAQLIFIAPPGPGPAEFARHRRFVVYSSLETFRTALINEGAPYNPRAKAVPGEKRSGLLGKGRASKGREQNPPAVPPLVVPIAPMPPTPPTPRIVPSASAQPVMPPTPRVSPQASGPDMQPGGQSSHIASPISPTPQIEDMDTHTLELENPAPGRGIGAAAAMGALTASALDDDDALAPPVTPRQPQGGGVVPSAQGSATPGASPARTVDGRRAPTPLLLGQQTNTPRPGGSGKLPASSAQGSQTRTGKQSAAQGRGTKQLVPTQGAVDAPVSPKPPNGKNGGSGKLPAVLPVGVAPVMPMAASGVDVPAAGNAGSPPIPAAMAVTGMPGGPGMGQRQVGLTPLPPPVSQRRRRSRGRKRLVLFLLLGLLTLLVICGIVVSALGGPSGLATLGRLTATVTITPQSKIVQNDYLLSGVTTPPDTAQRQVAARVLTAPSDTKSATANATGSIPAAQATGILKFTNSTGNDITLGTTTLTDKNGVQVTFNGPVFVPGLSSSATVRAYADQAGAQGNIPAQDIFTSCCAAGIGVQNLAFSGGQNAQPNSIIQQSDIDGAAKPLITQLTTSGQAALQKQVQSNERVVDGSSPCNKPTISANHNAGDHATSVTVNVLVACTEEVFDFAGAQKMAQNLLATNLPGGVDLTGYRLVGSIITSLVSATVVSGENQVSVNMQATGRWAYQFSDQLKQQIRQALVKHSKSEALSILRQYAGLASATINISSGSIMPANASDITVNIAEVPGLSPGAPGATATPYVPVGGTPTGGSTPTGTGTPSGGS